MLLQRNYNHKQLNINKEKTKKDVDFKSLLDFSLLTEYKGFFCIDLSELCFKSINK